MTNKEHDEQLAFSIITDYLKEEKNIQIKNDRHLTQGDDPPDYYFEIRNDKIGCEVRHFSLVDRPKWEKGKNLKNESKIKYNIMKRVQRRLDEKGIPPLVFSVGFVAPPKEALQHTEQVAILIAMMHNESIADSNEYKRNDPDKYYELFIEHNINAISFCYIDAPDSANIDEKYPYTYGGGGDSSNRSQSKKCKPS